MMTPTVGEKLRKAREEKKLTLEQVSQGTHIRLGYLKSLEEDDIRALPSLVQARGFLRLVADYLGLPAQPLLDQMAGKNASVEPSQAPENSPQPTSQSIEEVQQEQNQSPEAEDIPADEEPAHDQNLEEDHPAEEAINFNEAPASQPAADSTLIFQQIGQELRLQRERLSLSIDDIERYTKLRYHYILALENGQIENLPSPVQGRGMLSNYADFLNMDTESLLLRFAEALQTRRIEKMAPVIEQQEKTGPKTTKKPAVQASVWKKVLTPDLVMGGSIFILLVVFIIWSAIRVTRINSAAMEPTPPSISEMLIMTDTPSPTPTLSEEQPPAATANPVNNPESPIDPNNPNVPTATLPPIGRGPLQVYVIANQRAWMKVTVDGSVVFEGRTSPGNAYPFSGSGRIELLTGNGAALQVIYNETDLGVLGVSGEVVNLIFTMDGMVNPTPAFTPTYTQTSVPTFTPQPTATQIPPTITPYLPSP